MTTATLSGSLITMKLGSNDRGHISVEFVDPSAGNPQGKRVELTPDAGSADFRVWTNSPQDQLNSGERSLPARRIEYCFYKPTGSEQTIQIRVRKADKITNDIGQFDEFTTTDPNKVVERWLEATHAVQDSTMKLQKKRWVFTDGGDQVIITIIMQDNEGGGEDPIWKGLIRRDEGFALRLDVEGSAFTIPLEMAGDD